MNFASLTTTFGRLWIDLRHGRGYIVDTITGLSDREKKLIKDSKDLLLQNPLETGSEILLKFFSNHPQYTDLYHFQGTSSEEMKTNKAFLEQCTKLMSALETWIEKLDDPGELKNILEKASKEYVDPGFSQQYFKDFEDTFIDYIVPLMDKKTVTAWRKLMRFAIKSLMVNSGK